MNKMPEEKKALLMKREAAGIKSIMLAKKKIKEAREKNKK